MKLTSNLLTALTILLFSLSAMAHDQSATAAGELNLGVQAYKQAKYEEAIWHFEKAVALAPENTVAHLYLATAYASQYIPGVDTPDNDRRGEQAIEQYQRVLDSDAEQERKINSAKGIAYLYLNMKKFYHMAADLDPKDPEPRYSIGVIDWTECYQPRMEERAKLGLKPSENLNPKNKDEKKVCDDLRIKNESVIEEGIDSLSTAIQLRPDYDDAMAYLNLMYREKADLECDDLTARAEDLKVADDWVDKTLAVKKAKAEKTSGPTARGPQ
jgi:tetratricopeptide (TPR) repeat protein